MKKVQIVLPEHEKAKKEQNYGYMRPLKTRDKNIYRLHSKDWNKKKRGLAFLNCFLNSFLLFFRALSSDRLHPCYYY